MDEISLMPAADLNDDPRSRASTPAPYGFRSQKMGARVRTFGDDLLGQTKVSLRRNQHVILSIIQKDR
jgi:hypothetical protein